jgi:hypothetical protein
MKIIIAFLSVATLWYSAFATSPVELSPADQVRSADVIAVVSVTNVTRSTSTNAAGHPVTVFVAHATVERILKGTPPKMLVVKDETEGTVLSADNFSGPVIKSGSWHLGTSHLLVFLKRSGDLYVPDGARVLFPVWGSGVPAQSAVTWPHCTTLDKAEAIIQKTLKK